MLFAVIEGQNDLSKCVYKLSLNWFALVELKGCSETADSEKNCNSISEEENPEALRND